MKNLIKSTLRGSIALILGLTLVSSTLSMANSSSSDKGGKSTLDIEILNEFNSEIIEDIVLMEEYHSVIMIFDENERLIYDAEAKDLEFDPVLEILLRRSDFLIQVDGIRYYRLDH